MQTASTLASTGRCQTKTWLPLITQSIQASPLAVDEARHLLVRSWSSPERRPWLGRLRRFRSGRGQLTASRHPSSPSLRRRAGPRLRANLGEHAGGQFWRRRRRLQRSGTGGRSIEVDQHLVVPPPPWRGGGAAAWDDVDLAVMVWRSSQAHAVRADLAGYSGLSRRGSSRGPTSEVGSGSRRPCMPR